MPAKPRHPRGRPVISRRVVAAVAAVLGLVATAAVPSPPDAAAPPGDPHRDVVLVANAEGGTVSIVDADTLRVARELDVLPDGPDATLGADDPVQALVGQRVVEAAGGTNYAQDQDLSPDGRTLYVSRGHRGDVAAFDLVTGDLQWKVPISGLRADHMTLSPDGRHLYVSALTENVVEVVDTAQAAVVASFSTGEWPHDNHFSHDGTRLYNASIGNIVTPWEWRAHRPSVQPALPEPYQLTVVDPETLEEQRTYTFDRGVRPYVVTEDGSLMFAQLSEFHGLVAHDLTVDEEVGRVELPIAEGVTEDDYSFEAPHHGLAMSPDERLLCVAGRASDYVALVDTSGLEPTAVIPVGDAPSWAANGPDGRHCFVPNTREDTVSVISYAARREVARIGVGDGPKHVEAGRVPAEVLRGR